MVVPKPTAAHFVSDGVSVTISPVGVGENGRTTYVEEIVPTEEVVFYSDTTTTATPPPATLTCKFSSYISNSHMIELLSLLIEGTIEEDASGLVGHASVNDPRVSPHPEDQIIQSCNFQGTTAGSCVQFQDLFGMSFTTTYSGSLIPVYTLTETASTPDQTQKSEALGRNSILGASHLIGLLFIVWAIFLVA